MNRGRLALEIRRARRPFATLVALGIVAVAAAAYILGSLRTDLPWEDSYTVRVAVDDAKGVVAGKQEVRLSGVPVGRITKVQLDGGRPVLTVSMDRKYAPLYRDARLALRPKTPLNDLYLDVERRGHASAGTVGGGTVLSAERTRTPVDIGRLLNTLDASTRTRTRYAINALGRALPDHGDQLRAALAELTPFLRSAQRLSRVLAERRGHTRRLVHNFRLLTAELGTRQRALTSLVRSGAQTLQTTGRVAAPLEETVAALPSTLHRLRATFADVRAAADELDPALDGLREPARSLPAGLAALQRLSDDARPAIAALRPTVPRLRALVRAAAPTASDLAAAFAELRPQAPQFDDVTAMVVPCEHAVAKFFHNTLSVFKYGKGPGGRIAFPRGHLIAGISSITGDVMPDPQEGPGRTCAPGGPRK